MNHNIIIYSCFSILRVVLFKPWISNIREQSTVYSLQSNQQSPYPNCKTHFTLVPTKLSPKLLYHPQVYNTDVVSPNASDASALSKSSLQRPPKFELWLALTILCNFDRSDLYHIHTHTHINSQLQPPSNIQHPTSVHLIPFSLIGDPVITLWWCLYIPRPASRLSDSFSVNRYQCPHPHPQSPFLWSHSHNIHHTSHHPFLFLAISISISSPLCIRQQYILTCNPQTHLQRLTLSIFDPRKMPWLPSPKPPNN